MEGRHKKLSFASENSPTDHHVIIATFRGVHVLPETLSQQGSSPRAGDFRGLKGASVEEIISRVPKAWKMVGQDDGRGIKFVDDSGTERIRLHRPGDAALAGRNSASGWVLRIMDRRKKYYDDLGNMVARKSNSGHIPIKGNPNA